MNNSVCKIKQIKNSYIDKSKLSGITDKKIYSENINILYKDKIDIWKEVYNFTVSKFNSGYDIKNDTDRLILVELIKKQFGINNVIISALKQVISDYNKSEIINYKNENININKKRARSGFRPLFRD